MESAFALCSPARVSTSRIETCTGAWARRNALRSGDWKIIRDAKEWQLYDLARDIGETTNLAAKETARVKTT